MISSHPLAFSFKIWYDVQIFHGYISHITMWCYILLNAREEKKVRCLHCKRFGRTRHEKAVTIHAYMIQLCIGTVFNFDNNVSIPCVPPSLTRERKKIMLIIIIKCETEKVNHNLCGAYLSCHDTIYSIEFSDLRWEGTSEDCPPRKIWRDLSWGKWKWLVTGFNCVLQF